MSRLLKEPDIDTYAGRFAAKLRELRLATGMSGEQMAEAMGEAGFVAATRTYYSWESGEREPPLNALPAIARALGCTSVKSILPSA